MKTGAAVKKSEQENVRHSSIKRVTKKFLEVSRCSRAKQRQRNVQKSVLHVQSYFLIFLIRGCLHEKTRTGASFLPT